MARTSWRIRRLAFGMAVGMIAIAISGPGLAAAASAAGDAPVKAIVTYKGKPGATEKAAVKALGGKVKHAYTLINGMAVDIPAKNVEKLRESPKVTTVEHDATVTALEPTVSQASTGDFEYDNAWGVAAIGTKFVHDAGITGQGVKLAVIDTGIDYIHDVPPDVDPEFLHNYKGGYDFVNNDADPMDDNGHGTHVAGIVAAEADSFKGVAPHATLYAYKALNSAGSGVESDIIEAIERTVDPDEDGDDADRLDIVNASLGS